jgi:hypothetical protein
VKKYRKGKRYNWKKWKIGDRIKANPDFEWGIDYNHKWEREGSVTRVTETKLSVTWDDKNSTFYSFACSSLINISKPKLEIGLLPDSLFEI